MKTPKKSSAASAEIRRRAELELGGRQKQTPMTDADAQRQRHELEVHQIELELQNAELQKTRDELEISLENYTDLYDFAPVGYFTLAASGAIGQVNLTGASLIGIERAGLVGQSFGGLVPAGQRRVFNAFLKKVFAGPANQSIDFELLSPAGQPVRTVNLKAQRLLNGQECRVAMVDITDRKRAENIVRVSEIRHRRLFEAAHDGVLLLDPGTCKITDANPFMSQLLGYPNDQLVGKELYQIGLLKDETASREMFQKLKQNHEVRYEDLPLESQAGRHQEVEVVANLYQENGHAVIQCNIRDITARKKSEAALRESEARFRVLANAIPQLAWIARSDGFILWYNQRWYDYTGTTPKQMKDWGWQRIHDARVLPKVLARWKVSIATGQPLDMTFPLRGADGTFRSFLTRVIPLKNAAGQVVQWFGTNTDVEDLKQAEAAQRRLEVLAASNLKLRREIIRREAVEAALKQSEAHQLRLLAESRRMQEQLRHLSRQVLMAQEEERKRISRELHDVIAQTLTGINLRLDTLRKEAGRHPGDFDQKLAHTQELVGKSVDLVHRFARELRPAVLDDLGLIPALHAFMKDFTTQTGVRTQLTAFARVEKMDIAKRTVLFRVAQEALTNVARHAHASRAAVSLQKLADRVCLQVTDDGQAFAVPRVLEAAGSKRLGLLGMRERVEMVGGTFGIKSAPGQGTTVRVELPFAQAPKGPLKKAGKPTKLKSP